MIFTDCFSLCWQLELLTLFQSIIIIANTSVKDNYLRNNNLLKIRNMWQVTSLGTNIILVKR